MYQQLNDADLMSLVVAGNHQAFAQIVERHTDRFFALAYRSLQNQTDAEDVVQQAFIKLWQKPAAWNSDKSQFTTWFYRVIVNACHDLRRGNKRVIDVDDEIVYAAVQPDQSEQQNLEYEQDARWKQKCVEHAMGKLPESQRDALNLVVYAEMPQKQAADVLGISLKALESLLVRAKKSMIKTINSVQRQESAQRESAQRESAQRESAKQMRAEVRL